MWRRKIGKAFELADEFEESPAPHRFRTPSREFFYSAASP
jgi:hypothetical protein